MNATIVVIPTYNESENISDIVLEITSLKLDMDILVVDDSSPDGTADVVRHLMRKYSHVHLLNRSEKLGLGPAYVDGFNWALKRGYTYLFEMDADFSHPPKALIGMLEILKEQQVDLVVGSRYKKGIQVNNWPFHRIVLSLGASFYVRLITGLPVADPTAGYVGYHTKVLQAIDLEAIQFKGYAFQIALKFWAWKKGFHIEEFPIIFTDRTKGESKMNGSIIKEAIFGIISMKWRSLFNKKSKWQKS